MVSSSCAFGVGDLPRLVVRPELVAHKFYLKIQPAAFFCLYERVRTRALDKKKQEEFSAAPYAELPLVKYHNLRKDKIKHGGKVDAGNELTFFFDLN